MADTKISALTAGTAASTDRFPIAIDPFGSGDNRYLTPDLLGTYYSKSTLATGTITTSQPMTLTQTWNDAGVTFTALKVNVTSTASAAASQLIDLQVGGVTKFIVTKAGLISLRTNGANDILSIGGSASQTITAASNALGITYQLIGDSTGSGGPASFRLGSTGTIEFNSAASLGGGARDVGLYRNGAGVLEVNSATPGTFRDIKVRAMLTPMTSELTIATGAVTATGGYHNIDTESDAASDDLDTINGGVDGMRLVIRANNTARTVVVKDATGNIQCAGDMSLDSTQDTMELIYDGTLTAWLEVGRSDNGA
jgi:hypothetical protein